MAKQVKSETPTKPSGQVRTHQSGGKVWRSQHKDGNVYYVTLDGQAVRMPEPGKPVSVVRGATLFPEPTRSEPKK